MGFARRLTAFFAALTLSAFAANAEIDDQLAVATGQPGSDSFVFGAELWAMSQIVLAPAEGIVLASREVAADGDRLALLQNAEVEAALVYGRVPNAYEHDARAVMALWPEGKSNEDADPVQFLVHKSVPADVVYQITKAMFEHAHYFKRSQASLGVGTPSEALTGLDIPLHAGAYRYFQQRGFGQEAPVAADYWGEDKSVAETTAATTPATYRNFDDPALAPEEVEQIAAACRHALDRGALTAVLGDLATTGCEVYQDRLVDGQDRREPAPSQPATALAASGEPAQNDDAVDGQPFEAPIGQGGPAILLLPAAEAAPAEDVSRSGARPASKGHQPVM